MVEQHGLRADHVPDCDDRKIEAPRLACFRIRGRRPGGTHAGTQDIRTDYEIALGIDRPAWPDHRLPPARFPRDRMHARDMLVSSERMANQHRVGTLRVERSVGLVGNLEWREVYAGVEPERLVGSKIGHQRLTRLIRFAR